MGDLAFATPLEPQLPPELSLDLGGVVLVGTSVAARATAFALPQLGVAVDMGRLTPRLAACGTVLLTHGHLDHTAGLLAYLNLRARFYGGEPTRVFVPGELLEDVLAACQRFPGMASVGKRLDVHQVFRPLRAGEAVELGPCRVVPFAADHGVPALGLRLELGQGQRELVFAGDGNPELFRRHPELLGSDVAVVECSFLEPNRRLAARLARHAHVQDWIELAPVLPCRTLVLTHLPEGPLPRPLLAELAKAFSGQVRVFAPEGS